MACARYSSVFPWEKMDMLKTVLLGSLIFRLSGASFVVTWSFGGTYGMDDQLFSCPFLHSESFSPSRLLRTVLIFVCCQSVVPPAQVFWRKIWQTHRSQTACMMLENFAERKVSIIDSCFYQFCMYSWLDGLAQKNGSLLERHPCLNIMSLIIGKKMRFQLLG